MCSVVITRERAAESTTNRTHKLLSTLINGYEKTELFFHFNYSSIHIYGCVDKNIEHKCLLYRLAQYVLYTIIDRENMIIFSNAKYSLIWNALRRAS